MLLQSMLDTLTDRTKQHNVPLLTRELNSALSYVWNRLYQVVPDLQITFETTGTFGVDTQQFDLAAEIAATGGEFFGHKTFYIMDANQNKYVPVVFCDTNDYQFQALQQEAAQLRTPVLASAVNFGEIRFAPPVPSGTGWRSDWIGKPPNLSLAANTQTSIPEPLHGAMVDLATAQVFNINDDTREVPWQRKAEDKIIVGIHAVKLRQQQTPQTTRKFPASGGASVRRWATGG